MNQSKSNFNQALWLGIGQLCTFLLSFVSAAILSRVFDKTEYGTYKQILYVYNILNTIFTVGLPSVFAYYIPRLTSSQQKFLIGGINRLFVILGVIFSLSLFFLSGPLSILLKNEELAVGLRMFAPFPLFTLPAIGVEGIYTALKRTRVIAIYHIVVKSAMLLCIVSPVFFFKTGYKGAVLGWGAAAFVGFLVAMWLKNEPYKGVDKAKIPNLYRSVLSFSLPLMGASIAGLLISFAYQFYISRFYGTETFAEFSNGAISIPIVAMIASSVKSVLLPLFSKADAEGDIGVAVETYHNSVVKSITLVFPILLFFMFFADDAVIFLFGEKYETSSYYMRCFIIRDFFDVLPYYAVLLAIGKSKVYMDVHIVVAILTWLIGYLFVSLGTPAFFFVLNGSVLEISLRLYCFWYIFKVRNFNLISKTIVFHAIRVVTHCTIFLLPCYLIRHYWFTNINSFTVLCLSFAIFYFLLFVSGRIIHVHYFEAVYALVKRNKI